MKYSIAMAVVAASMWQAMAEPMFVTSISAKYQFVPEATADCEALRIAGTYEIEIGDNGQGRITDQNDRENYLFFTDGGWVSRTEIFDFDTQVREVATLNLTAEMDRFQYQKETSSMGSPKSQVHTCDGKVKVVAPN